MPVKWHVEVKMCDWASARAGARQSSQRTRGAAGQRALRPASKMPNARGMLEHQPPFMVVSP